MILNKKMRGIRYTKVGKVCSISKIGIIAFWNLSERDMAIPSGTPKATHNTVQTNMIDRVWMANS